MDNNYYMKEALKEAEKAFDKNEVPVGCVIVYKDKIIARSHNLRNSSNSSISHAEILAIQQANEYLDTWILEGCTIYVTLEPCPMCAGAIIQSRIDKVVYGANDPKTGSSTSVVSLFDKFPHQVEVESGLLQEESSQLIKSFFKKLRQM